MTNFDYLNSEPQFHTFAPVAISAEKIAVIDPSAALSGQSGYTPAYGRIQRFDG